MAGSTHADRLLEIAQAEDQEIEETVLAEEVSGVGGRQPVWPDEPGQQHRERGREQKPGHGPPRGRPVAGAAIRAPAEQSDQGRAADLQQDPEFVNVFQQITHAPSWS